MHSRDEIIYVRLLCNANVQTSFWLEGGVVILAPVRVTLRDDVHPGSPGEPLPDSVSNPTLRWKRGSTHAGGIHDEDHRCGQVEHGPDRELLHLVAVILRALEHARSVHHLAVLAKNLKDLFVGDVADGDASRRERVVVHLGRSAADPTDDARLANVGCSDKHDAGHQEIHHRYSPEILH
eukprot:scaffold1913_cov257-Pinguiococcus_pyrenoidosus.AAC.12